MMDSTNEESPRRKQMEQHVLFFWGAWKGSVTCTLFWDQIFHDSAVIVTACEGEPPYTSAAPVRFVGYATFTVNNVAPIDGAVVFRVTIDWDDPLNLWTTVTVFDRTNVTI